MRVPSPFSLIGFEFLAFATVILFTYVSLVHISHFEKTCHKGTCNSSNMRTTSPIRRNFQAQADELGDNYFVSFSKTTKKEEHWTYYLACSFILFLLGYQTIRFRRDFILHSAWSIFDGFLLLILTTMFVALLLPRERDPNEPVASTMLVHESTIFQKGRLPIMREFSNFVLTEPTWWSKHSSDLLSRYVDDSDSSNDDGNSDDEEDEALRELEEVTSRVLSLIHRIIRNSEAPKILRKMLREEAKTYLAWVTSDGFIFNWIASLPESLGDVEFDSRSAPKTKLLDIVETKKYRLWLKQVRRLKDIYVFFFLSLFSFCY